MSETIIEQLTAAVAARKSSLAALRERIMDLIAPIPVGVVLYDDGVEVGRIRRVCTGASQWSNRTWDVTIKGKGLIVAGKLACHDCAETYHDGNNLHYHSTEPFCLYTGSGSEYEPDRDELSWLSGRETRETALRLPRAIARYIDECEAERAANELTANGAIG